MENGFIKPIEQTGVVVLTEKEKYNNNLCSIYLAGFKNAMIAKAPYAKRWANYMDAYFGEYFKNSTSPDYKSDLVSNYIFSIIETIRPIMLDQNPKFQAVPRQPEGMDFSNDLHEALSYEWDREDMSMKLYSELINMLVKGTAIFFLPWDANSKNVSAIPVNADNFFVDPLATNLDNAETCYYANYVAEGLLQHMFPEHADKLRGGNVHYTELVTDGSATSGAKITNQILVLEIYTRDWAVEQTTVGETLTKTLKYPNGRVITMCPELNIVLADKAQPYKDKKFPFVLLKDYDIPGKFWGEGEVAQLLSPQSYMNELNNSIIDNAKHTANVPWIIDKTSGIGVGKITNRPGLVIRKNPGSVVERPQPPSMPAYVNNAVQDLKRDMEQISGIFDTVKGNSETGVYTAQGILALQEAGQARIRLKVKLLEASLSKMACMWYSRMQQYWKTDRFMRITRADGSYDFKKMLADNYKHEYDIKITAGSTMSVNRGAMLDLMIRLAQTQMPDGQMLVDRQAVAEYLPEEVKSSLLRRMKGEEANLEKLAKHVDELAQKDEQEDMQTMQAIEQVVGAVEKVNKQILQLQQAHDTMVQKQKQESALASAKDSGYNSGYADSQTELKQATSPAADGVPNGNPSQLPDEMLQGIHNMTDDELKLLTQEHPELIDMINAQN